MIVEVCMNNENHEKIEEILKEKDSSIEVDVQGCLGHCHVCATGKAFAFVDGDAIEADSVEELVDKILNK